MSTPWINIYGNSLQTLQWEADVGSNGMTAEQLRPQSSQAARPGRHHKSKQKYGQLYVTKADVQQSKFCNYVSESVL